MGRKKKVKEIITEETQVQEEAKFELPQLSEIELLKFSKIDAELRLAVQQVREIDNKMEIEKLRVQSDMNERQKKFDKEMRRLQIDRIAATKNADIKIKENTDLITQFAEKFQMDPACIIIDTDSGMIKTIAQNKEIGQKETN